MSGIKRLILHHATGAIAAYRRLQRSRLALPLLGNDSSPPTIYFFLSDFDQPSGGVMAIYRHVDILNNSGVKAFVLHQRPGFRCTWFENDTKIAYVEGTTLSTSDLLVFSEIDIDLIAALPKKIRFAVFNQSGHLTWSCGRTHARNQYSNKELVGVVVVSEHSRELVSYAFPNSRIHRIHLGIDTSLFHNTHDKRPRRLCYMSRRGQQDAELVFNILEEREVLRDWSVCVIDGRTHAEVARCLRTSRIFLSFSYQEGFGLPVAEAMACGNYVVGYHAYGGRELFQSDFSTTVDSGDAVGFAKAIEQAVRNDLADDNWCQKRGEAASRYIDRNYSLSQERSEVLATYSKLLAK